MGVTNPSSAAGALLAASNLSDLGNVLTARNNLGTVHPSQGVWLFDHFTSPRTTDPVGDLGWTPQNYSKINASGTINASGVAQVSTLTSATGLGFAHLGNNMIVLGGGEVTIEWYAKIDTLSTGTERFHARAGIMYDTGVSRPNYGVYFFYQDDVDGGNWQAECVSNSTRTTTSTGIAATTNYTHFKIIINAAATSAAFYINGTLVATVTTNIPTTFNYYIAPQIAIAKSIGTTARTLTFDWFNYVNKFTTPHI